MMSAQPTRGAPDPGFRTGVVRGISHGLFGPPTAFAEAAAGLGVGLVRAYVYWSQVEPEEGRFDFAVVDGLLDDLDAHGMDVWLTVCSSSPWATRVPTTFQPQSPALDPTRYGRFVQAVVRRCAGRVHYWQCNNEPSNTGLLWAGTAEEYLAQLRIFYDVVRRESPAADVVLGGCGYDYLSSEPGSAPRRFFEVLVEEGREAFDLFSVHLYDDPARIPGHVEDVRSLMRKSGAEKPVVVGEYAGPSLFELPDALAALETAMITAFGASHKPDQAEPPDRRAMRQLYDRLDELPDGIRIFLEGCPPELEALRERVACRQMVTRNVLALAAGAGLTVCWDLAPEIPHYRDRLNMLGFLSGTFALLDFDDDGGLTRERPAAATLRWWPGTSPAPGARSRSRPTTPTCRPTRSKPLMTRRSTCSGATATCCAARPRRRSRWTGPGPSRPPSSRTRSAPGTTRAGPRPGRSLDVRHPDAGVALSAPSTSGIGYGWTAFPAPSW